MDEVDRYQSPLTWRYASKEMRYIWSERYKRLLWRRIWLVLAEIEQEYGLVRSEQVADLEAHVDAIDYTRSLEIEKEIHHDLMAELQAFAEQSKVGRGVIHLGMTSMDVVDNADALRVKESIGILLKRTQTLLSHLLELIEAWADVPVIGFTHLQPAEPTTLGYRFAIYAQDLRIDYENLVRLHGTLRMKGLKGAVGTRASFADLVGLNQLERLEDRFSEKLGLAHYQITHQTYPRKQDYDITCAVAGLGASLSKMAFDLRLLQSPLIGEMAEPFSSKQVGSSAMPFKRNPILAEKINSLARYLAQYPRVAWDNAAFSLLERTLDDSANRRFGLAEPFLITDELLLAAAKILRGLKINREAMGRNLADYAPFSATERVLLSLTKAGADRQEMHEILRVHALTAWEKIQAGESNPLPDFVVNEVNFQRYLSPDTLASLMDSGILHVGDAGHRARAYATELRKLIGT